MRYLTETQPHRSSRLAGLAGVIVAALLMFGAVAGAAESPQSDFFRGNGLYAESRYDEAVQVYSGILAGGVESAHLHFNLGNAYFKLGRRGEAIRHYQRAIQMAPGDPDIEANLGYALTQTGAEPCAPSWWQRLIAPLATAMNSRGLSQMAGGLFTVALLFGAAYRIWRQRPRWLFYLAGGSAAATLLVLISLGLRLRGEEWRDLAVVVAPKVVPARFEPAANGTTHFSLEEGSRVAITDRRESWLQVERCDGRRGWVESTSVATLR